MKKTLVIFEHLSRTSRHMAGETGGDREGPSPPGPVNSSSWVGPGGGTEYITKWALFTSLGPFFSNSNSCIGGFGPFETLGDPSPRGPPRPSPPPPPPPESFLQPWNVTHVTYLNVNTYELKRRSLTPSHRVAHCTATVQWSRLDPTLTCGDLTWADGTVPLLTTLSFVSPGDFP